MPKLLLLLASVLSIASAIGNSLDNSTYANIEQVISTHLSLDFSVDFDKKHFDGYVIHKMKVLQDNVNTIFFDMVGMSINFITIRDSPSGYWYSVDSWNITSPKPAIGSALQVTTMHAYNTGDTFELKIFYTTNNKTTAISWMTPEQTACHTMPYLFTQCEDIACRSVAPMQDTPAIKITYDSRVTVKSEFKVKMSANETNV